MNQYHKNFITGAKIWMAKAEISTIRDAAKVLGIGHLALYKVLDGTNKPTADLGIKLCLVAGINANWLFLGKETMEITPACALETLIKRIDSIEKTVNKIANQKPKKREKAT